MDIDTAMAARFLTTLTGDAAHTFQTFGEAERGGRTLKRILHGTFARHAVTLQSLNLKGAGVFVLVNRGDGLGRKSDNVIHARALFVDLDGAPIEPVLACSLPPRIVVESSPGKWHAYWPMADLPLGRFTDAQKALADRFDGDPVVNDRTRVMRLPGFLHNKAEPFQTRLLQCDGQPLTWHEMVQAFDLRDRMRLPDTIREGSRNTDLFKLASSAARKGVPEAEQLRKAQLVNARRCDPPLDPAEVAQIVASAYRSPVQDVAGMPLAVMDSEAYKALCDGSRTLLLAYRKHDPFNELFPLTWTECRPWVQQKKTFQRYRTELVEAGLIVPAIAAERAQPRNGKGPKPAFYRLGNRGQIDPHLIAPIGVKTDPPEALQAVAVEAPATPAVANGRPDAGRLAA